MNLFRNLLLVIVLMSMSACTLIQSRIEKDVREQEDNNKSFAFITLDMSDAPIDAHWVRLRKVDSDDKDSEWIMRVHEHVAYMENLPKGKYMITRFGGASSQSYGRVTVVTNYGFDMPDDPKENKTTFTIKKPGVYYLGDYKYKEVSRGRNDSVFDLIEKKKKEDSASKKILPYTEGTQWHKLLKKKSG